MRETKDSDKRLKLIRNSDGRSALTLSARVLVNQHYNHDVKMRNCIGKFLHERYQLIKNLNVKPPADATLGNIFFEMDNGFQGTEQWIEKISNYYSGEGSFRVIFFLATRYSTDREENRLNKLFEILRKVMYRKPNRILGACYCKYLKDGKVYNLRNEEVEI
jgi:hypothetical protein